VATSAQACEGVLLCVCEPVCVLVCVCVCVCVCERRPVPTRAFSFEAQ